MYTYTSRACNTNLKRIQEVKKALGQIHLSDISYTDYRFIMDCLNIAKDVYSEEKEYHQSKGM